MSLLGRELPNCTVRDMSVHNPIADIAALSDWWNFTPNIIMASKMGISV